MSLYESRLSADKDALRDFALDLGQRVRGAVTAGVQALLDGDPGAAAQVILGDLPINRDSRALDARCHAFVARHIPSAGHLRFVSATMRMNVALERIGDYAVTIAREAVQLTRRPPPALAADLGRLARQTDEVLAHALAAYGHRDAELARQTRPEAKGVSRTYEDMLDELLEADVTKPELAALLTVLNKLDRVSDQAKNIGEDVLFEVTGETKPPKVYRVLFVDARDSLLAPLAAGLARRAFPESGRYDHAGWQPAEKLADEFAGLAESLSLELDEPRPRKLDGSRSALRPYNVVVGLQPGARGRLEVPYSTVFLEWSLPGVGNGGAALPEVARALSTQIGELMRTLRGEEAS